MKWIIIIASMVWSFFLPKQQPSVSSIIPLEELVGQRFIWEVTGPRLSSESATLITTTHAGGVIIMGELTSSEIASLTAQIRTLSHKLPFIIAIDQEGGSVKRMMDDENPGGIALGRLHDNEFCQTVASTSAKLVNAGVNTNFGIIGDIGWNPYAYITNRTYGNSAEFASNRITRALECSKPILTTIKHFPGHGRTQLNSHFTIPNINISLDEWQKTDAQPFLTAIGEGVDIIMFGHLHYQAIATEPATLSQYFHTYLKDNGFSGLTITDDLGMLEHSYKNPIDTMKRAFAAGNDVLLYTTSSVDPHTLFHEALVYATSSSEIYASFQQHYNHIKEFKRRKLPR